MTDTAPGGTAAAPVGAPAATDDGAPDARQPRPRRSARRHGGLRPVERVLALAGGAGLLGCIGVLLDRAYRAVYEGAGSDYVAFATGSRIVAAGDRCLYCLPRQAEAQAALLGYRPTGAHTGFPHTFANAPLSAWLLQPVAGRSLADGLRLFEALGLFAAAMAVVLVVRLLAPLPRRRAAVLAVAAVASLPASMGLLLAQWDPFVLVGVLLAMLALRADRRLLAGLLLSVLLVKPQTGLLVLPALLAARAWRPALGFALGGLAWWGSGLVLAGPGFIGDLATLLRDTQTSEGTVTAGLPSWSGFTPAGNAGVLPAGVALIAVGLAALVVLRRRLATDPEAAVAVGIALSLAVAPHVFSDDLVLLLPGLLVVARRRGDVAALLYVLAMNGAYLVDQAAWPGGPRALEALCSAGLAAVLLVPGRGRARGGAWARLLALVERVLAALEAAPDPAGAASARPPDRRAGRRPA